jgi:hypothetical protein
MHAVVVGGTQPECSSNGVQSGRRIIRVVRRVVAVATIVLAAAILSVASADRIDAQQTGVLR